MSGLIGARLGSYRVDRLISRGGQSFVYRAVDERDGSEVALKLVGGREPVSLARFEREIVATRALEDVAGFVRIIDAGEHDGRVFYTMPLVAGTLRDLLESRAAFGVDESVRLTRTLAMAMGHAHKRGIVHRDLKPENVLLDEGSAAQIADLGLARLTGSLHSVSLTGDGETMGSACYLAPEVVLHGAKHASPAADVYALGCMAIELLTGTSPFEAPTQHAALALQICYAKGYSDPIAEALERQPSPRG